MRCNCPDQIHPFACFMRNIATDANSQARSAGSALNAR
jgi:hypothetical protein